MTQSYLDTDAMVKRMSDAGWIFPCELWDCLSEYDKSFIELEFTGLKTVHYYEERLKALGMNELESIMDAACGMGQWSIAMANLNKEVYGTDITPLRLLIARELAKSMNRPNADFKYAPMESMNIDDQSMNAVFCYGSFMFANMDKALAEFNRVLKPGGRLYLNANSWGWYMHLFIDRGFKKRNLKMILTVLKMIMRTFMGAKSNVVVSEKKLESLLQQNGFKIIEHGSEGDICIDPSLTAPERTYSRMFYGFPGVIEYLVEKV